MALKQLLLIVLSIIIVGLAITLGLKYFNGQQIQSNKDGVSSKLMAIATNAYQYKSRPVAMSGGGGVYDNSMGGLAYSIPPSLNLDGNGSYTLSSLSARLCVIQATSSMDPDWVAQCSIDADGQLSLTYSGWE